MNRRFCLILLGIFLAVSSTLVKAQTAREDTLKEIQRQIDILTQEIERMKLGEVAETKYEPGRGLGPAAAKVYQLKKTGVSLAGYGEVVYENYSKTRDDGVNANKPDQIDFLRNVVYVGFRFNDWILFNSEIEFEHSSTGRTDSKGKAIGEVSVEFGYIEFMLSKEVNIRAGMVLPPMGIINEKHEPTTFFGTLRPEVERVIIPSTWRTNGIGVYGELAPSFQYRAYIVEGLDAKNFSDANGIRGGRQSGAKALAEDFGFTGRFEYTGFPGSVVSVSAYTGNSGQSDTLRSLTTVWSVQGEYTLRGLELRGLYGRVNIDEADRLKGYTGGKTIGSSMFGWYVVAGYDVMPSIAPGSEHYLAPFVQYEKLNTHASVPSGFTADQANDRSILTVGLTYKPHPSVGFKFDYRDNKNAAGAGVNQWNLALAYLY